MRNSHSAARRSHTMLTLNHSFHKVAWQNQCSCDLWVVCLLALLDRDWERSLDFGVQVGKHRVRAEAVHLGGEFDHLGVKLGASLGLDSVSDVLRADASEQGSIVVGLDTDGEREDLETVTELDRLVLQGFCRSDLSLLLDAKLLEEFSGGLRGDAVRGEVVPVVARLHTDDLSLLSSSLDVLLQKNIHAAPLAKGRQVPRAVTV
mmetsp:Transcript_14796/g.29996  ORF Transcript_14796/g.29996 Transcript_14796/m.29996 type:complete len:205 (+) Transcript_14796:139-753(+)